MTRSCIGGIQEGLNDDQSGSQCRMDRRRETLAFKWLEVELEFGILADSELGNS